MGKEDIIHHIDCLLAEILPGVIPEPKFWRPLERFENLQELTEISKALEQAPKIQKKLKSLLGNAAKKVAQSAQKILNSGALLGISKVKASLPEDYQKFLESALFDFAQEGHKTLPESSRGIFPEKSVRAWAKELAILWTEKAEIALKSQIVGFALEVYRKEIGGQMFSETEPKKPIIHIDEEEGDWIKEVHKQRIKEEKESKKK